MAAKPDIHELRFSKLHADATARTALQAIVKNKAHGVVIDSGEGPKFLGWQYIANRANKSAVDPVLRALDDRRLKELTTIGAPTFGQTPIEAILTLERKTLTEALRAGYLEIAPPNYFCPNGDYQSRVPGKCPYDGKTLTKG